MLPRRFARRLSWIALLAMLALAFVPTLSRLLAVNSPSGLPIGALQAQGLGKAPGQLIGGSSGESSSESNDAALAAEALFWLDICSATHGKAPTDSNPAPALADHCLLCVLAAHGLLLTSEAPACALPALQAAAEPPATQLSLRPEPGWQLAQPRAPPVV